MVVIEILSFICALCTCIASVMSYRILSDIKNIKIYSKEIYDREGWL
jgi:hypothetical protein